MNQLWSPWRSQYIQSLSQEKADGSCFLCAAAQAPPECDSENLVVYRGELGFVIMNRFPYNSGHLLIAPYRHVGDLVELADYEAHALIELVQLSLRVLRTTHAPHGFNVGTNLGRTAGAGLPDHVHVHVVPRWNGDTNFMPVLAEVKVISEFLSNEQRKLSRAFADATARSRDD
ncbi:MAG: HIT domain-containing protein [Bacteroidota bacterium]|nr:HIT domain-containing protein [Candidatus Kapabacteria bacterium]MCS7301903.1 HIT domain-containing protein [Candidatus Kapabacteria bacterium]MCX7936156.1 HIT domain-containing protein [Chlorobiota bacterium]MDW8074950.1 HIT domain-containing protein [Bacteroidota bacterium]